MAQKQSPPVKDDFKQIKGIGPKSEARLHEAGILTYAQLAQAKPEVLAQILVGMSVERIVEGNWCGQAEELAPKFKASANGQHYATFTVELLLDQSNNVRRTRISHVQDEAHKDTWAGWHEGRLVEFIRGNAGLKTESKPQKTTDIVPTAVSPKKQRQVKSKPLAKQTSPAGMQLEPVDELYMVFRQAPNLPKQQEESIPPEIKRPIADRQQETAVVATSQPVFEHGRSFDVRVRLDLSRIEHNKKAPLSYHSSVFAVDVAAGTREKIGTAQGATEAFHDEFAIQVPAQIQLPGTYRLEAETNLAWLPAASDLTTAAKGSLVHIY